MNNFLDGIFIGHLIDHIALAAVGVAYPLAQFAQGLGTLIGTGVGSAISIWLGANEKDKLKESFGTVNFLTISFSVLITITCYYFADELVYMMGGRGDILKLGVEYFQATILGSFFWIYGLAMNMIVRAEGRMKTAAWMIAVGLLVDVALKPVFIHTFGWGVAGAAWATNISMIIYTILGIWYYAGGKASFKTTFWSIRKNNAIIRETLSLGMPGFIILLPFWLYVMFRPGDVMSIMIPDMMFSSGQLKDFRAYMSVLLALPFVFMALVWFPAIEDAKPATVISILRQVVFYIPALLIVPPFFGVSSIYIASAVIDWIIFAMIIYAVMRSAKKLQLKRTHPIMNNGE